MTKRRFPLLVGNAPVVVGRIVHVVHATAQGEHCAPAMVHAATEGGDSLALEMLHVGAESGLSNRVYDPLRAEGTWHWPDPNDPSCQGLWS